MINKKNQNRSSESRFYERNFLRIKFGKFVKPADNRLNFTEGHEDFINIKCSFEKNKIKFSIKNLNSDFFLLSPLFLRSLDFVFIKKLFTNLSYCLIDNFEIILMQNSENFSMILKIFFYKKENEFRESELFNFYRKRQFQLLFSFDYFFSPIFFSLNMAGCLMSSHEKKYLTEKKFKFLKIKNNVFLEFEISQKIHPNKQRFLVFKKKLSFFILTKIKKKTLLFCKKYSEYILLRNHVMKISEKKDIILVMLNEYLSFNELTRRKNFCNKKKKQIILVTERYYHHHRSIVSNVNTFFFYSFPYNWEFFLELIIPETTYANFEKVYSLVNLGEIE